MQFLLTRPFFSPARDFFQRGPLSSFIWEKAKASFVASLIIILFREDSDNNYVHELRVYAYAHMHSLSHRGSLKEEPQQPCRNFNSVPKFGSRVRAKMWSGLRFPLDSSDDRGDVDVSGGSPRASRLWR